MHRRRVVVLRQVDRGFSRCVDDGVTTETRPPLSFSLSLVPGRLRAESEKRKLRDVLTEKTKKSTTGSRRFVTPLFGHPGKIAPSRRELLQALDSFSACLKRSRKKNEQQGNGDEVRLLRAKGKHRRARRVGLISVSFSHSNYDETCATANKRK